MHSRTSRLDLHVPVAADLDALYEICSDPQSWTHFPSLRHTEIGTTERMLLGWVEQWRRDGLGTWIIRVRGRDAISGYGGCSLRRNAFWNLGYRLHPDVHGKGYATEMCEAAIESAHQSRSELPVVAYLLEHNVASAKVAERVGLTLLTRGPDIGNPNPKAIRLVYADRPLSSIQVASVLSA
ncbi:GNAT family N-acetyltransferase [Rhodococcus sp. IEGM 1381]|uniref:GNAT family N-acetyltransferase n=1 Tax=Rhodococcus sp. IEGM 1381 TaxID=3047085 RepID=UPI0024B7A75D|nr:GNAT family N-acetyltransferase [Rhodococcus sp. IEGM 1381]MDI9895358.1 GNAT family N-acetyltransferase [Rhodococcus sp. IEGM 1381]